MIKSSVLLYQLAKKLLHLESNTDKGENAENGFTLAEVLITLGIIGVVAAMTIPTLVNDYQTKTWNTTAEVFEKKLEVALKTMNTQQTLAGHANTESFINELKQHFKINTICSTGKITNCFSDKISWEIINISDDTEAEEIIINNIETAQDLGQYDWSSEAIGVQFANGITAVVAYNDYDCKQDPYSNQIVGSSCLSMIYDTSGFKSPNTTQKDVRGINSIINKCSFRSNSTCYGAPFSPSPHFWNACQEDGTSTDPEDNAFMSEYGIRQCCWHDNCKTRGDYWAGAAKACGGTSKMIKTNELAKYLYPDVSNVSSSWYSYSYCPKDSNGQYIKCKKDPQKLGLNGSPNKIDYIFSGTEAYDNGMMYWQYSPTYAGFHYSFRYATDFQAICVTD